MNTLLLDQDAWDLVLDSNGNIALASDPYSVSQDVASALKLFKGELYYQEDKGVPYFEDILGQLPPISLLTKHLEDAALSVPTVVSAQCTITSFEDRQVVGQVAFVTDQGQTGVVTI